MLKVAIIYEDGKVWIEFLPEKFRELLKKYFKETKSIDKALDKIITEIKQETAYK
jgi:hypothetical protein